MQWLLIIPVVLYLFRDKVPVLKEYIGGGKLAGLFTAVPPGIVVLRLQSAVFFFCILYLVPFSVVGLNLENWFYSGALWVAVLSSIWTITANYKLPNYREDGFKGVQAWLSKLAITTEFHFLFYSCIMLGMDPFIYFLVVPARRAMWTVFKNAAKVAKDHPAWESVRPKWEEVEAQEKDVLIYMALVEISIGFYFVAMVCTGSGGVITTIAYWNFLQIRYSSAKSHEPHSSAWNTIGAKIPQPIQNAPGIKHVLDFGKRQFVVPHS